MRKLVSCLLIILSTLNGTSQIQGHVYDIKTSEPLTGAVLIYKNGMAITDSAGNFIINTDSFPLVIVVSHLGYNTDSIYVINQNTIRIGLLSKSTQIEEVVVSVPEFERKLPDFAGSISILMKPGEENKVTFNEVLNKVAGLHMQSGNYNTNRITIRGIGSRSPYSTNRLRAYFEEIPMTTGEGVTTIEDIDIESLGRIEIIKGPASGIYGAGLGGVINLYTDTPSFEKIYLKTSVLKGSFGTFNSSSQAGYKKGNLFISGGFNSIQSDGYRQNNKYSRQSGYTYMRKEYKNIFFKLFVYHIKLKAFIPSSVDEFTYLNNPKFAATNWFETKGFEDYKKTFAGIAVGNKPGKAFKNHTVIYTSFFDEYELRPFNVLEDKSASFGGRTRFSYTFNKINCITGVEAFNENYNWDISETVESSKGNLIARNKESRMFFNSFLHTGIDIKKNTITAGMNLNSLYYDLNTKENSNEGSINGRRKFPLIYSPRLGFTHKFNNNISAFFLVSHGFSAPSLEETLNPEGTINKNLKPELGWSFETGTRGNLFKRNLKFELSIYRMIVNNLLVTKRISEEMFTGINAGQSRHFGVELNLNYSLPSFYLKHSNIYLTGNYTVNKFNHFIDDGKDYSENFLPGVPRMTMNIGFNKSINRGLNLSIEYRTLSSMYLNDDNSGKIAGYSVLNASMGYKVNFNRHFKTEIYTSANNILNEHYSSMILINAVSFGSNQPRYYYPGLPINFTAGIRFEFSR